MPLSRAPHPEADLFSGSGREPDRTLAHRLSSKSAEIQNTPEKSSPRHVLPKDLSNALQQLDDMDLDGLFAATRHELQRRGRLPPVAEIGPPPRIGTAARKSEKPTTLGGSSERRQAEEFNVALTQGQLNAVRASIRAGITPSRIAKQFGISQSDVRKVLATETRGSGKGGHTFRP